MKRTSKRNLSAILRLGTSAAILFSIAYQITDRIANDVFRPYEYLSYLTIQTGFISVVVLAFAGVSALSNAQDSQRITLLRLWVVSFEVVIGIFYNLLLRGSAGDVRDAGYNWPVLPNEILHTWAPIILAIEWMIAGGLPTYAWKKVWWIAVWPLCWLSFSILRGAFAPDHWWAYWFLDPGTNGENVPTVVQYILLVSGTLVAFGFVFTAIRRGLARMGRAGHSAAAS
ncbi:MAG: hypothetical protein EBY26_06680 [Microbacteriaceae bacterium]|nr:hypothetical protein [Microbacteriaceae bacterium]